MKSPDRIPRIIKKLTWIWTKVPVLRFYQLLEYIVDRTYSGDKYYMEDEQFEVYLDNLINELKTEIMKKYE